jgi:hypothetical protein
MIISWLIKLFTKERHQEKMALYLEGETLKFTTDSVMKLKDVYYKPVSPNNTNTHILNFQVLITGQVDVYNAWKTIQAEAASEGFPENPVPKISVSDGKVNLFTLNVGSVGTRMYPEGLQMSFAVKFNMATEASQYSTFMSQLASTLSGLKKSTSDSFYSLIDIYTK